MQEKEEVKRGDAMTQLDLFPSFPANPYKTGTHKWRVWEHLASTGGKITTFEIHHVLHVDPTRVNDVSHRLQDHKYIQKDAVKIAPSNYLYEFVRA
jgi:hypothetical protein